jgi:hypothetical protein
MKEWKTCKEWRRKEWIRSQKEGQDGIVPNGLPTNRLVLYHHLPSFPHGALHNRGKSSHEHRL